MTLFIEYQAFMKGNEALTSPWDCMYWIDCDDVVTLISDERKVFVCQSYDISSVNFNDFGMLYHGADEGALAFEVTEHGLRVRFVVPNHYELI